MKWFTSQFTEYSAYKCFMANWIVSCDKQDFWGQTASVSCWFVHFVPTTILENVSLTILGVQLSSGWGSSCNFGTSWYLSKSIYLYIVYRMKEFKIFLIKIRPTSLLTEDPLVKAKGYQSLEKASKPHFREWFCPKSLTFFHL